MLSLNIITRETDKNKGENRKSVRGKSCMSWGTVFDNKLTFTILSTTIQDQQTNITYEKATVKSDR